MVPTQPEAAQLPKDRTWYWGRRGPRWGEVQTGLTGAHEHAGLPQGLTDAGDGMCIALRSRRA